MTMKLYELTAEMEKVENTLDLYAEEHEGDITNFPYEQYYEQLEGERANKLLNLASWAKSLKAEVEAHKAEIRSQQAKKKTAENKLQWVKDFLTSYLKLGEKLKDGRVSISWRKSKGLVVDEMNLNMANLDEKYHVVSITPDKALIKKAIMEDGTKFEDFTLEDRDNVQIK